MLSWQINIMLITSTFLIIASYTDLKKREVPDWISYGLIFSALGVRLLYSINYGWEILITGFLGLITCIILAYLFYLTNQWGGGDSKILMGMGAVIGLDYDLQLIFFFLGLLIVGAAFGLIWCLILAIKKRIAFIKEFKEIITKTKKWQIISIVSSGVFLILTLIYYQLLWLLIPFPIGMYYLLVFAKATEKSCFTKKVEVKNLVEGDWLAEDIIISPQKTISAKQSLNKQDLRQIWQLNSEKNISPILIKEGIPFIPAFLFSYIILIITNFNSY